MYSNLTSREDVAALGPAFMMSDENEIKNTKVLKDSRYTEKFHTFTLYSSLAMMGLGIIATILYIATKDLCLNENLEPTLDTLFIIIISLTWLLAAIIVLIFILIKRNLQLVYTKQSYGFGKATSTEFRRPMGLDNDGDEIQQEFLRQRDIVERHIRKGKKINYTIQNDYKQAV